MEQFEVQQERFSEKKMIITENNT